MDQLRALRRQVHLSREDLSARAGISAASIKAYDTGVRHPSREALIALLDALDADAFARQQVLSGAGYAPDFASPADRLEDEWFTLRSAAEAIADLPHPACITTELFEVVAANAVIQRVWEVDLHRELQGPFQRGFLSMLTTPRFARRLRNWSEALSVAVSVVKGHYGGDAALDPAQHPYLAAAVQFLMNGSPEYVQKFLDLWNTVPGRAYRVRLTYPVVWANAEVGELRFISVTGPANDPPSIWFNDWVALDARTAEAVHQLRIMEDGRRPYYDRTWPRIPPPGA